jgi:predicted kinase
MSIILILIGATCSGKTSFANQFMLYNNDFKLVEADAFERGKYNKQFAVQEIDRTLLESFESSIKIIFDGTNLNRNLRTKYINMAKKYRYTIIGIDFGITITKYLECKKEQDKEYDWEQERVIHDNDYEKPLQNEGFDMLIRRWCPGDDFPILNTE